MKSFEAVFKGKKILITGNTGFKGSWLSLWLANLGADVYGYALEPPTNPSLYGLLNLGHVISHQFADIRDFDQLRNSIKSIRPDIIFHMAAQSLVRESYERPRETIEVNILGMVNLLEAVRLEGLPAAVVIVTTDKCYENKESFFGYRETDSLGGYDPYSASKGASEILIASWRKSFFHPGEIAKHGVRLASVRAGNVIGGGDWAKDRIVPDCMKALQNGGVVHVRNPYATRPWQHVLEPLGGYLELASRLIDPSLENVADYCEAFNFGPLLSSNKNVKTLVESIVRRWGRGSWTSYLPEKVFYESSLLHLCIDKAYHKLGWLPKWDFDETVKHTVEWYQTIYHEPSRVMELTLEQIQSYEETAPNPEVVVVSEREVEF